MPVLTTVATLPALATTAVTASAYGSVMASAKPGAVEYRSNPFALGDAVSELRAAMKAEADRLARKRASASLLGVLSNLISGLLGLVDSLFNGTTTTSELRTKDPDLYRFLDSYRSAMWPVSPTLSFSTAIGTVQSLGPKSLIDTAVDRSSSLGQYFVAAFLNSATGTRIDSQLLWPERVRTIAQELNYKGYFEPTAGVRWDSLKVLEWWRLSLGIRL